VANDGDIPPRPGQGILSRRQRVLAWVGFLVMAAYAPVMAYAMPDDTWLLSVTIAAIVAFVILVDDRERHRRPAAEQTHR
jgi:hypothetical protein